MMEKPEGNMENSFEQNLALYEDMRQKVVDKAKEVVGEKWALWFVEKRTDYVKKIEDAGLKSEGFNYLAYHVLCDSTVYKGDVSEVDFPYEISVKKFYEDLLSELETKAI